MIFRSDFKRRMHFNRKSCFPLSKFTSKSLANDITLIFFEKSFIENSDLFTRKSADRFLLNKDNFGNFTKVRLQFLVEFDKKCTEEQRRRKYHHRHDTQAIVMQSLVSKIKWEVTLRKESFKLVPSAFAEALTLLLRVTFLLLRVAVVEQIYLGAASYHFNFHTFIFQPQLLWNAQNYWQFKETDGLIKPFSRI